MAILQSRHLMKVILIGINFVSSHGLKPSDYGSYNAPSFGQASNDQVPVVPHASNPNDAWNNFEEQQYQQQYGVGSGFDPTNKQHVEVSKLTQFLAAGSKVSLTFLFFMLMWRSLHHYEVANSFKGLKRTVLVTPTVLLFLGDLFACVTAFTTGLDSHIAKRRAKAVLNLGKILEAILFVYNVTKMSIFPSRYIPQEIYIAGAIHNFVIINILHQYTKLSFGGLAASVGAQKTVEDENFYDQNQYGYDQGYYGGYEDSPSGQQSGGNW